MTEWILGGLALIALWALFGVRTAKWVASLVPLKTEGERVDIDETDYRVERGLIWWESEGSGHRICFDGVEYTDASTGWRMPPDMDRISPLSRTWDELERIKSQIDLALPEVMAKQRCSKCRGLGHRSKGCTAAPPRDALYQQRLAELTERYGIEHFRELKDGSWRFVIGGVSVIRECDGGSWNTFEAATGRQLESDVHRLNVAKFELEMGQEHRAYLRRVAYEQGARGV